MKVIDNYFKEKTQELTFIELKENSFVELKGYIIDNEIPLPILTEGLIQGIKKGDYKEEIKIGDIIEGIIYTLGTDKTFLYIDKYKEILHSYDENIADYIFCKAIKDLEMGRSIDACIKLRGLLTIKPENINAIFNYALGIEEIAKELIEEDKDKGELFLNFSISLLESILEEDKDYTLAYYKLGYYYMYFEQYLKASLTWKKFIRSSKDEILVQEVRNEVEKIDDDVLYETGLTYLIYNDFEKALELLLQLVPKYKDNWNLNFSIGKCYSGLEKNEMAVNFIEQAISLNELDPDLYNELGIIYYNSGDIIKAIKVFTKGIDNCPDNYNLLFNRGMSYMVIEEYENALSDITYAYTIDSNEDIKLQKEYLEKIVDTLYNDKTV